MSRIASLLLATPLLVLLACEQPLDVQQPDSAAAVAEAGGFSSVVTRWPTSQDPGAPFYARIEPEEPHVYHDGTWAAVLFYRSPSCIRADFNLLQLFDVPNAFFCTPLVSGTSIWGQDGPGVGAPRVVNLSGQPEVWFIPAAAIPGALADGQLTIGELAAIPGTLMGTATQFNESLQPHSLPEFGGGGHPNPRIVITAHGKLTDGRSFQFQLNRSERGIQVLRIVIR